MNIEDVLRELQDRINNNNYVVPVDAMRGWLITIGAAMQESDREYLDLMDRRDEAVMQAAHLRIALRERRAEIERLTALLAEARAALAGKEPRD